MKLTIEKRHVEKAIEEVARTDEIAKCCPVFQCAKEAGIQVTGVGYDYVNTADKKQLRIDEAGVAVTRSPRRDWPSIQTPIEIELTEV